MKSLLTHIDRHWKDILIAGLLGVLFACTTYYGQKQIIPSLFETNFFDVWFESDVPRVFAVMTDPGSKYHARNSVHPLFSLFSTSSVFLIKKALDVDLITAMRMVLATVAFLWLVVLFALLRSLGCRRLDSILFSFLAALSAASIFWFVIPETFSFGSLSILLALGVASIAQRFEILPIGYVVSNVMTFSFTITNGMAGILASLVNNSPKRAAKLIFYSIAFLILLWGVQKVIYPQSGFPLEGPSESRHMFRADSGGAARIIGSFFYHTIVMPQISEVQNDGKLDDSEWPKMMMTQFANLGSGSLLEMSAVIIWSILLMIGGWALFFLKEQPKFRLVLGLLLLGQLGMHLIYGNETFLYSLHFLALLIPLVALGLLTKIRKYVMILVLLLIPCLAFNNFSQFVKAIDFLRNYGTERQQTTAHMSHRVNDPWPRGEGHVILAYPGTNELDKAYYEPGGSFSPSVGSFGVSIWVMDKNGEILKTSDSIPIKDIHQQFIDTNQRIPGIKVETDYYEAVWSGAELGKWRLTLKRKKEDIRLQLVVRSVGPAGGPIKFLEAKKNFLLINNHWNVIVSPFEGQIILGDETHKDWIKQVSSTSTWKGVQGWGYAKFLLPSADNWTLIIEDPLVKTDVHLKYTDTRSALRLTLPDEHFMDSLNAQVSHLMMSVSGFETHPSDPVEFPYPSHREASYQVVALARAGQIDVAKQLSTYLAENDFFGGMGTEADGPGLLIWALIEVADILNDKEYDQFIWPHIKRKVEFIEKMLSSTKRTFGTPKGRPIAKSKEEAFWWMTMASQPAKNGLIIGKVEEDLPIFYVNAVSYLGLVEAASLADRIGHNADASHWRTKATVLKKAWEASYVISKENPSNPWTYISALWPSKIVDGYQDLFLKNMLHRWQSKRDQDDNFKYPQRKISFAVGEAHQWLLLNDLEHTWRSLLWFWRNQSSPGLYTWWEVIENNDAYGGWKEIRGWLNSTKVTPQYGLAARMILLQLDMLGYLEEKAHEPTVVIGAGVPVKWLSYPMEVKGLLLSNRTVDWSWDGHQVNVIFYGDKALVKLGPAFPKGVLVKVIHIEK